jgi:gliding motility-associated-like protein
LVLYYADNDLYHKVWSVPLLGQLEVDTFKLQNLSQASEGIYSLSATYNCGTIRKDFIVKLNTGIDQLYIPNSFTPNDDLINDQFYINTDLDFSLKIFNRWGEEIITLNQTKPFWDGFTNSLVSQDDVYIYLLQGQDCNQELVSRTGSIRILR